MILYFRCGLRMIFFNIELQSIKDIMQSITLGEILLHLSFILLTVLLEPSSFNLLSYPGFHYLFQLSNWVAVRLLQWDVTADSLLFLGVSMFPATL